MRAFIVKSLSVVLALIISIAQASSGSADTRGSTAAALKGGYSAEESFQLAYMDTLYYRIERWIPVFNGKIAALKSATDHVETRLELTKFYYNLGGLYVELSHIMGFNSTYKIQEIAKKSLLNTRLAKQTAKKILARDGLTDHQKAQAYMYLGSSEGSLGVLEFRAGNIFSAFINGFRADTHLEKALSLDPKLVNPYLGLGIYRYSNSRMGGLTNLFMQGGRDERQTGLAHIQRVVNADSITTPLATMTLSWFYIAVQINPDNADLPADHPLSPAAARSRVHELIDILKNRYFKNPPGPSFVGNKGFAMMQAIQFILDGNYIKAREQFEKILRIINFLGKYKGYKINPEQETTVRAGIKFCGVMISGMDLPSQGQANVGVCSKISKQVDYLNNGGRVIEYEVEKIRDEINEIFIHKIENLFQLQCKHNG